MVGFVDDRPRPQQRGADPLTILGTPDDLPEIVHRYDVERVIIAFSNHTHREMIDLMRLTQSEIQIDVVPRLFENLSRTIASPRDRRHPAARPAAASPVAARRT